MSENTNAAEPIEVEAHGRRAPSPADGAARVPLNIPAGTGAGVIVLRHTPAAAADGAPEVMAPPPVRPLMQPVPPTPPTASRSRPGAARALFAGIGLALAGAPDALAADVSIFASRTGGADEFIVMLNSDETVEDVTLTVTIPGATALRVQRNPDRCTLLGDTVRCATGAGPFGPTNEFFYYRLTDGDYTLTARIESPSDTTPDNNTVTVPFTYVDPSGPRPGALPAPVQGRSVNVSRVSGVVRLRPPGSGSFVTLQGGQQIPVGSLVDVTGGRVRLSSAAAGPGQLNMAEFSSGQFRVTQRTGRSLTQLVLTGGNLAACPRRGASVAEARGKRPTARRLWGRGAGDFQTVGRGSATTARGTAWLVEDRCEGTFTRVTEGRVAVRDFARRRTVLLRAPQTYLARRR